MSSSQKGKQGWVGRRLKTAAEMKTIECQTKRGNTIDRRSAMQREREGESERESESAKTNTWRILNQNIYLLEIVKLQRKYTQGRAGCACVCVCVNCAAVFPASLSPSPVCSAD